MLAVKNYEKSIVEDERLFANILIDDKELIFYPNSFEPFKKALFELVVSSDFDMLETPSTLLFANSCSCYIDKQIFYKINIKKVNENSLFYSISIENQNGAIIENQNELWNIEDCLSQEYTYKALKIPVKKRYYFDFNYPIQHEAEHKKDSLTVLSNFGSCKERSGIINYTEHEKFDNEVDNFIQKKDYENVVQLYLKFFEKHGIIFDYVEPFLQVFYQSKKGETDFSKLILENKIGPFKYDFEHSFLESEMSRSDVFKFGKYKFKTLGEVFVNDPDYVFWCLQTISDFYFDSTLFYPFNVLKLPSALSAIEYFIAKTIAIDTMVENYHESKLLDEEAEMENKMNGYGYSDEDSYRDAGGGNEWSDDTEYWS